MSSDLTTTYLSWATAWTRGCRALRSPLTSGFPPTKAASSWPHRTWCQVTWLSQLTKTNTFFAFTDDTIINCQKLIVMLCVIVQTMTRYKIQNRIKICFPVSPQVTSSYARNLTPQFSNQSFEWTTARTVSEKHLHPSRAMSVPRWENLNQKLRSFRQYLIQA